MITRALWTDASQVTRLVLPESLLLFASGMGMEMNVQEQISTFDQARLLMIVRKIPRLIHFTAHIRIISHAPGLLETLLEYHYPHLNSFQLVDYALDDDSTKQKMAALKAQMLDGGRQKQHVQQSYTPESWTHHYQQPPQPKFHPYHGQQGPQPMMARHPPQGLYSGQSSPVAQSQLQLQRSQLKESQQQQQLEEDTLRRLCRNCLRLLEFCPNLKLFESKVPLPLEDLIGSIPRWSSASSLTMLRIEIQEFTGSGAVDMEEEMVMQMFVKSLFMGNGKNGSPGSDGGSSAGGDSGSFSGSTSSSSGGGGDSSPPTGAMAALVLNQRIPAFANGSPTFLPSSDSTASTSTSESSKSGRLGITVSDPAKHADRNICLAGAFDNVYKHGKSVICSTFFH
ncbi:hypothetical protein BGZ83_008384 [Gryganskiella cystojenkinii]|nr:hypothetical protein BGZ83_008384 [Gryganskiella cystojenkinii]